MINKVFAILKKDFLIESSYKLAFLINIFSILVSISTFFFIDRLFAGNMSEYLQEFGTSYFAYVLIGMAFFSYIGVGLGSFSSRLRAEQLQGTLESLIVTPTKLSTLLSGMVIWNFLTASFNLLIYLLFAVFVFKIDFSSANIPSCAVILFLAVLSFSSLGIISASFILVFKRGNPLSWLVNTLEGLLGGVYFPIKVMPQILQTAAKILPITHAIRAIQLAVYKGYSLGELKKELLLLLIMTLVLVPLAMRCFKYALRKARFQGSLSHY